MQIVDSAFPMGSLTAIQNFPPPNLFLPFLTLLFLRPF